MSNRLISTGLEPCDSAYFVALGGYNVGERYSKLEKVARWLIYGVILSGVPFFLAAGYEWYIGYEFNLLKIEYVPGFVTITFSVAANACGYVTDIERSFKYSVFKAIKRVFMILSAGSLCVCLVFYSWLLGEERNVLPVEAVSGIGISSTDELESKNGIETFVISEREENEKAMSVRTDRATVIAMIVAVFLVVNVIIGVIIECFSSNPGTPGDSQKDKEPSRRARRNHK